MGDAQTDADRIWERRGLGDAKRAGREQERERIVQWLRKEVKGFEHKEAWVTALEYAIGIERGEHWDE